MKDAMLHEARQTFIHAEAKKLRESLKIEMDTPTSFFIVKEILDRYDNSSKLQPEFINNVNTDEEYYKYLSDIKCIYWEFVEWIEKQTGECLIKGCFEDKDFEAVGIKNCGEIVDIKDIKIISKQYDCLNNQFCDKQSKDGKMFCKHDKGCNFKVES